MSSTDTRTVDPAEPHHSENGGHEMSDFSWTTVLWLLPIAVIVLLVFFGVSIAWFKGAKDKELDSKQAAYVTTELNQLHAKENEILTQYKIVDKNAGRFQIPIKRAMELIVQENQDKPGKEWVPVTDTYLEGAAFKSAPKAVNEVDSPAAGIQLENVATPDAHAAPAGHAAPAQDASKQMKSHSAPGGGAEPKKAH